MDVSLPTDVTIDRHHQTSLRTRSRLSPELRLACDCDASHCSECRSAAPFGRHAPSSRSVDTLARRAGRVPGAAIGRDVRRHGVLVSPRLVCDAPLSARRVDRLAAADDVREPRQPFTRTRDRAATGNARTLGTRRFAMAACPTAAHGECPLVRDRHCARHTRGVVGCSRPRHDDVESTRCCAARSDARLASDPGHRRISGRHRSRLRDHPAWRASQDDQTWPFRVTRSTVRSTSRGRALTIVQVALAAVLLIGAGLLTRNLQSLRNRQPGFETDGVSLASLVPQPGGDARLDVAAYCRALADQLRALPGVQAVALSIPEPIMGLEAGEEKRAVAPSTAAPELGNFDATLIVISPEYFRTMGVPLTRGRDFTWLDDGDRRPVVIVSAALAAKLFPASEAIGRLIRLGADRQRQQMEIVGVSADARLADLHTTQPLFVFMPILQASPESVRSPTIEIRSRDRSVAFRTRVRRTVESLGQDYVARERMLAEQVDTSLLRERLLALAATFFGALAGALMAVGLGGVVSYAVTHRTREMGIRAALGASPSRLRAMILMQTLRISALGLGIGLPAAWVATRLMRSTLPSIDAHDPLTFASAGLGVAVITLVAAWLPARRAAAIQPTDALRCE